jgi:hypothetical protein
MPAKLQWAPWAGVTNPRHQVIWATKFFFMVMLNMYESPIRSVLHVTLLASKTLMWGPGFVENLWTPNLRCCLSFCEVKKLKTVLVQTWERLHILRPSNTTSETPYCRHLLPAMANISSFTKYKILDIIKQLLPLQLPWGCENKSYGWCTWTSFPLMTPVPTRKCRHANVITTSKGYYYQHPHKQYSY